MSTLITKNAQIGTSGTPADNFTIFQPATPDGTLRIGNGNTGITTGLVTLNSAGNLGLGTPPSAWGSSFRAFQLPSVGIMSGLDANSAANYFNNSFFNGTNFIYSGNGAAARYEQGAGVHAWYTAPSGTAGNAISFTQAMTLDASGRLLISAGASAPNDASGFWLTNQSGVGPTMSGLNITFQTGSTGAQSERARIDSSGRLLVGTTSNIFDSGRGGVTGVSVLGGQAVYYFFNSSGSTDTDASPVLGCYKESATTSSSARFVQFYASGQGTPMGGIVGNGASNVQFASISDAREKTNIAPISGSLEKVVALRPVEFDWIANGEHCPAGFVAQDVEQVFPEFVVENMANDGEETRKGLTGGMTGGIVAHLVKAIQEQQALIQTLTARVAALESN
jgi:hypothetical protein